MELKQSTLLMSLATLSTLFSAWMNNKVLCLADKAWPDLSCHSGYSGNFIEQAHSWCVENLGNGNVIKINSCSTSQCCVLHMMGVLHSYRRGRPPVEIIWMGTKGKETFRDILSGELYKPVSPVVQYYDENWLEQKVNGFVENVSRCDESFHDVYRYWGLLDIKWDSLYNCVQRALGC